MVLTFAYSSKLLICVSAIIQSSKNVAASGTYFNRLDKKRRYYTAPRHIIWNRGFQLVELTFNA